MACVILYFFFCKQKTAYEMRISDWSSDVCSSDLRNATFADLFRGHSAEQKDKAEALLDFVGLYQKRHLISGDLSSGQQKLLEFAMALMNEPKEIGRASCRERVCQYV